MIQLEIKYQGKKHMVNFPSGWDEITFRQLVSLRQDSTGEVGRLLEILTGIERQAWMNMHIGITGTIAGLLEWVSQKIDWYSLPVPKTIRIGEKKYKVPFDLGLKTFGQKITLEAKVQKAMEEKRDLFEIMPDVMAIYFQPLVDDAPFNDERVEEIKDLFYDCPAVHVFPIAAFFLRNSNAYRNFGLTASNAEKEENTDHSRKRQESGILKKLTGIFSLSTRSRKR